MLRNSKDQELNDELWKMKRLYTEIQDLQLRTKVLQKADPRYKSKAINDTVEH